VASKELTTAVRKNAGEGATFDYTGKDKAEGKGMKWDTTAGDVITSGVGLRVSVWDHNDVSAHVCIGKAVSEVVGLKVLRIGGAGGSEGVRVEVAVADGEGKSTGWVTVELTVTAHATGPAAATAPATATAAVPGTATATAAAPGTAAAGVALGAPGAKDIASLAGGGAAPKPTPATATTTTSALTPATTTASASASAAAAASQPADKKKALFVVVGRGAAQAAGEALGVRCTDGELQRLFAALNAKVRYWYSDTAVQWYSIAIYCT
jgi:hypothetical protein